MNLVAQEKEKINNVSLRAIVVTDIEKIVQVFVMKYLND